MSSIETIIVRADPALLDAYGKWTTAQVKAEARPGTGTLALHVRPVPKKTSTPRR